MFQASLLGNIVADAEVRQSASGDFLSFRLAVNFYRKGERRACFVEVTSRQLNLVQYLQRGQQIYVSGLLEPYAYIDGNNSPQVGAQCRAYVLNLCSSSGHDAESH